MDIEDKLLQGAVDLHAHCYPEFSLRIRGRVRDVEWVDLARKAGMRAIVMKSHVFPTAERANVVKAMVPGIEVFGGIALNPSVGGLNPVAVEMTAELGGKVVWMPTWGSKNDLSKSNLFLRRMKAYVKTLERFLQNIEMGIDILAGGKIKAEVKEILQIAKEHRMIISSGHLSVGESMILVDECQRYGVPFIFAHPFNRSVGASLEEQQEISKRGGYVEHCFISVMPMHNRLEISKIIEGINAIGPEKIVLTTDAIQTWNPPAPEIMRMYIASLLHLGMEEGKIKRMVQENPAKLLGLTGDEQPCPA